MKSAIVSLLSGIVISLLLRGPAPVAAPQTCYVQLVARPEPAEEVAAPAIEALHDRLPAWLAGLGVPGADVVVVIQRSGK
jgi:hypothetical protein